MKLAQYIETHGTRAAAVKLLDNRVFKILGLSVHDLPETSELVEVYDEIENVLLNDDEEYGIPKIKSILQGIDQEFIEKICW